MNLILITILSLNAKVISLKDVIEKLLLSGSFFFASNSKIKAQNAPTIHSPNVITSRYCLNYFVNLLYHAYLNQIESNIKQKTD